MGSLGWPAGDVRGLPPELSTPLLTVLVVWRAAVPVVVVVAMASELREPGLGDRGALAWLALLCVVVLIANLSGLVWLRHHEPVPDWLLHPAALAVDIAVMVALVLANSGALPARTFLLEARDVFNGYVMGTAAVWTYLRGLRTGLAILGCGALAQGAGLLINGYPVEALGIPKFWVRQLAGLVAVAVVAVVATVVHRAVAEQRQAARLRAESARERAEMAALARAHDEVLPLLSAIVRATEGVSQPELERVRRLAQQADDVVREGFERHRSAPGPVRAGVLQLVHACRERQREAARPARVQVFAPDREPRVPGEARAALLAATEQALRNAERHAQADSITISIEADGGVVRVVVADDGVGFEPSAVGSDRFGLRGAIQRRLESVGGWAVLDTAPGQGCVWELGVPEAGGEGPPESGVAG